MDTDPDDAYHPDEDVLCGPQHLHSRATTRRILGGLPVHDLCCCNFEFCCLLEPFFLRLHLIGILA